MLDDDPIRAICWAYNLPSESSFHKSKKSIQTWDETKQLISGLDLRLRQVFWAISFNLGKDIKPRDFKKALKENPPPDNLLLPTHIQEVLDKAQEEELQQKRAELAAAASKERLEELKYLLTLPRPKGGVIEGYDE